MDEGNQVLQHDVVNGCKLDTFHIDLEHHKKDASTRLIGLQHNL